MLPNPLKAIFANLRRHDSIYDGPRRFIYDCHHVDDPALAERLRDWAIRRIEGRKIVEAFIQTLFNEKNIPYQTDDKGRLTHVLYCGQFLTAPRGWTGSKKLDHWMVPNSEEMQKKIDTPPLLPTAEDLHKLVNWPTLPNIGDSEESRAYAEKRNQLIIPKLLAEQVFLLTPNVESLMRDPMDRAAAKIFASWSPPSGLSPVPIEDFRALEGDYKALKKGYIIPFMRF